MTETMHADLASIHRVTHSTGPALDFARVDDMVGDQLQNLPGLKEIVPQLVEAAQTISEAAGDAASSIDLAVAVSTAKAADSGAPTGSSPPFDPHVLQAAIARLGSALEVGPLIDKIEAFLNDPANQAMVRKAVEDKGMKAEELDREGLRGALQSISPDTIPVYGQIRAMMANIHDHEALADSPDVKAALVQADADLERIYEKATQQIFRLMKVIHAGIDSTLN